MKLRYYADAYDGQDHEATIERLIHVHNHHDIAVEIDRVRPKHGPLPEFPGPVRDVEMEEIYNRDFDYNRTLSSHYCKSPSQVFKTNNSNRPTINGLVGVIDNKLHWCTRYRGEPSDDSRSNPTEYTGPFLDEVVERGEEALQDRIDRDSEQGVSERDIRNEFAYSGPIDGDFDTEVSVGQSIVTSDDQSYRTRNLAENLATRNIDLVIQSSNVDWVIEVKKSYNADSFDTVLGQVLVSDQLYREDNELNEDETQQAIVFGDIPGSISMAGRDGIFGYLVGFAYSHDIEVFVKGANKYLRLTDFNQDEN